MLSVLADRTYRHLFVAQVVALLGTGLATIALGLLAYDLSGERAGLVLGAIFTIKMVAYVGIAPIAGAFANRWPRRTMLVSLDLIRAAVAICLPFVTQIWQVYILIFVLQSASAAFTPTFQATIPDILPEEDRYTKALSLSRLAYDLENLISPALAAFFLMFVSYQALFIGTVIGFFGSALLVVSVILPSPKPSAPRGVYDRTTRGLRIYLATPRLRGLLSLNLAAAAAGAMVLVNTIVLVRSDMGLGETQVAIALGAFGGGIDAGCTFVAATSVQPSRPSGNDQRRCSAHRDPIGSILHVPDLRNTMASALGGLVRDRDRLFGCLDPIGSVAQAVCTYRRQTRCLCCTVCPFPRLLVGDLPPCRLANDLRRVGNNVRGFGCRRSGRHVWRCCSLATGR
jgi:MFS family permease